MASETPSDIAVTPLAAGFPEPDRAAWLTLVEKTLKGASVETLARRTLEGLTIEPLYAPNADAPPIARAAAGWDLRSLIRHPDPGAANAEALGDLAQGAASVLLRLDPTGAAGVAVGGADDLARVLEGVLLDAAPVALDAGYLGPQAADWLGSAAKGAPAAQLSFHLDPLTALAEAGACPGPIDAHLVAAAAVGARLAETYPRASLFLASGRAVHEAGGGEALELGFAAASALAYAKALVRAGRSIEAAFGRIVLGVSLDADAFLGLAKLRAGRLIWARLAGACGASAEARIEARASGRMLTKADTWTNLIRLTAAAFAGAVGGADAVVLGAFTDALGAPSDFARRQSRNIQLVLREEAHLGRVIDPAAGSGYVEALTDELARAGWAKFQQIEASGGAAKALESGLVTDLVAQGRAELAGRFERRELKVLGVTDFAGDDLRPAEVATPAARAANAPSARLPGPDSHCPALQPIRLEDLA
ncbi:MAG TPA: methylmalonyl-CoA mutase family protein [Caulobacteraceae bacterium]|nr:methylmalonyl-CoA mutase family protein [Caulobacteraceae bacterium]